MSERVPVFMKESSMEADCRVFKDHMRRQGLFFKGGDESLVSNKEYMVAVITGKVGT